MTKIDWIDLALQMLGMGIVFALFAIFAPSGMPRMVNEPISYILALFAGFFLGFELRWVFRRLQRKNSNMVKT